MKKKLKPIVLLICPRNVDGASLDATATILSNLHEKPPTALLSTFFTLDQSPFNHEKTYEKPVSEFL